jgi:peptidoglycan/xylan/chitin deacetylase (PgdA/CDA1 family)
MSMTPFVSVVVPVFNEEYLLADCLAALQRQVYDGQYEIIVVDNACTDTSPAIARGAGVRVVCEPRKGYVHALRAGFAAARGEIIACTDADTEVPPDWISRLVAALTSRRDAVAVGGVFAFPDGPSWLHVLAGIVNRLNPELVGGNMAMWRWAYEQVGGFDLHVNLQADVELGRRLRRLGRIIIDRRLVALTSPRRFQVAPWQAVWLHGVNYIWLTVFGRARFYDFPDIRLGPGQRIPHRRLLLATALMTAVAVFVINAETPGGQAFGPVVARVRADQPVVALTFDDGPSPYTAQVLDILARYQVQATFFVIGMNVEKYPDLVRRIVSEGHAIGNHTYSHPLLGPVESPSRFQRELDRADLAIQAATGVRTRLFRPPRGLRSPWMMHLARSSGYQVVTWSVSPDDWRHPPSAVIAERVLDRVRPGAIVLLHDGLETMASPPQENTVAALPAILEGLQKRGYRFVTVPELIEMAEKPRALGSLSPVLAER